MINLFRVLRNNATTRQNHLTLNLSLPEHGTNASWNIIRCLSACDVGSFFLISTSAFGCIDQVWLGTGNLIIISISMLMLLLIASIDRWLLLVSEDTTSLAFSCHFFFLISDQTRFTFSRKGLHALSMQLFFLSN